MKRRRLGLLYFGITLIAVIGLLMLLNWLPRVIQKGALKHYTSIDEVKADLDIRKVFVPAYFPQNLSWPPSSIIAQRRPFALIAMQFRHPGASDVAMVIEQRAAGSRGYPDTALVLDKVVQQGHVDIKDRDGTLARGFCGRDACSRISWREGDFLLTITLKGTERDIIRIARSMVPGARAAPSAEELPDRPSEERK